MMEDGPPVLPLPPPTLEPISRPSSTSTSASLPQLPGFSSLASGNSATSSPQMRPTNLAPPMYTGSSPAATTGGGGNNPTCQNCQTSTTPLWRRDEFGSVLCNACGLFLKLHNRPRPISLKTDVIKSRNRVKNTGMRPDLAKKKVQPQPYQPADPSGLDAQSAAAAVAAQAAARRVSQKSANGHTDGSRSPVSRTGTPSMYPPQPALPAFSSVQDPNLAPGYALYGSPQRVPSPMNGDRPRDTTPPTMEQLVASNASLHTRVGELELINKLYHDRVTQLEAEAAANKAVQDQSQDLQRLLDETRKQLEDCHRRENNLKRRLDELTEDSGPPTKKLKTDEVNGRPAGVEESGQPARE